MKKFYMTMAAMLCGVAAMAQNTLSASDIKVETGATAATLEISLNNADPIVAIGFRLQLTEGVAVRAKQIKINEDRINMEKVVEVFGDPDAEVTDVYTLGIANAADGNKEYSLYPSEAMTLLGNEGVILTMPMTLTGVADGSYDIKVYKISIGNADAVSVADEKEFTVKLNVGATGINSINAEDSNAPVYNVAGQRVSKAQKGVFIQNGKKVAVK